MSFVKDAKEEYIGETSCLVKEQINIDRQHIRQPQYQQLLVEEHLRTVQTESLMFFCFKILQENKSLKKFDEDYFIDKLKLLLNKKN